MNEAAPDPASATCRHDGREAVREGRDPVERRMECRVEERSQAAALGLVVFGRLLDLAFRATVEPEGDLPSQRGFLPCFLS